MSRRLILVALLILGPACGGSVSPGQPTPSSPCPAHTDNVSVQSAVISIANVVAAPSSCQVVKDGTNISASNGGIGAARFGSDALCNFYQLPPATAGAAPKTAYYTTRPVGGGLFHMDNGEADCTLLTGLTVTLCGQETLFADSTRVGVHVDCNKDPVVNVGVYRGSVTLTLEAASPPQQFRMTANQAISADPIIGGPITAAQFTAEQRSLFDVQLDSLLSGSSPTAPTSLLMASSLSPSDNVVAPNTLQTYLGREYGLVRPMCSLVSVPVVFYPADPIGSTPVLYGGVCTGKTARVYGLAIYLPDKLSYGNPFFFSEQGGLLVKAEIFANPVTLELGASRQLFTWKGELGWSTPAAGTAAARPGQASKDIYVAKFLYDVPPDTTPRIGLVAIGYGGASFPPIIS